MTLQVKDLCKRAKEELDISLNVSAGVRKFLVEEGSDKKFGARPLKRAIQNRLEDLLAESVLSGAVGRGASVEAKLVTKNKKKSIVLEPGKR